MNFYQAVKDKLLQNPVVLDVETTTAAKGNPFNENNKLVTVQIKQGQAPPLVFYEEDFDKVVPILNSASVVIGFNLKFDLHWIRRVFDWTSTCVWDCQLGEFMFSKQTWAYPDLATTCQKYEVGHKLDIVATEYWDKGIDTPDIPREILSEYGAQDVQVTWDIFNKQLDRFSDEFVGMFRLFRLHCNDLIVLQEMEYNGIVYDEESSLAQSQELDKQVQHLEGKIKAFAGNYPINLSSPNHVSCLLYGGKIKEEVRVPIGVYKTGAKVGQTRYKIIENVYDLPRLVTPLKGSELKKEGYFSIEEATLLSLKPSAAIKKLITWLLERVKLMKLKSTYLDGLPKVIEKHGWRRNFLHSNLNQCVATTGRLSSTKPNQQNLPKEAKKFCITRY